MDYNQPKMIQLLNLSTQLDNTNLGQPITKQCLILFCMWRKKVALTIKEKARKQNMVRSKCLNNFWSQIFWNFTGSPLYEDCLGKICHSLLYFAFLTHYELQSPAPTSKQISKMISGVWITNWMVFS